jgi:hypothetical protein
MLVWSLCYVGLILKIGNAGYSRFLAVKIIKYLVNTYVKKEINCFLAL